MQLMQMRFTYYANEIKLAYIRVELSTISLIMQLQMRLIQLGRWGWNSGCNIHVLHYHGTQTLQSS